MYERQRGYDRVSIHGYIRNANGEPVSAGNYVDEQRRSLDFTGKKVRKTPLALRGMLPPTDCEITRIQSRPFYINVGGSLAMDNYPCDWNGDPGNGGIYRTRGHYTRHEENNLLATRLLERTNPFRTEFSVPVFIKELVEVVSMFSLAARTFAGFVGGQYLNYRFGWVQFVKDIETLASITKALERRVREINSLGKHGGLRRKIGLGAISNFAEYPETYLHSTWGLQVRGTVRNSAKIKFSGSVRWIPTKDFAEDLRVLSAINLAFKKVFDLEAIDAETLWNLIPWTWLYDYFFNLGSYLAATAGRAQITPADICIMREYTIDSHATRTTTHDPIWHIGTTAQVNRRTIARDVVEGISFPSASINLLTASQWKVVLALFLRLKGG